MIMIYFRILVIKINFDHIIKFLQHIFKPLLFIFTFHRTLKILHSLCWTLYLPVYYQFLRLTGY
jgi:hypothetical protein